MIVNSGDANVIVNCDLLVHLAVDHGPVVRGANSLGGLYCLYVL